VFEWESEDGQKKKPFFIRRNKSFMQRKTDQQLLYQVYKAVDEKNGWGTLRKKCVKGRLFVNDEVVRLNRGGQQPPDHLGGGAHRGSELGVEDAV